MQATRETNIEITIAPIYLPFLLSFSSLTRYKPQPNVIAVATITLAYMPTWFISPNTEDSNSAVTIYLAMSISHLPNSFLHVGKDNDFSPFLQGKKHSFFGKR